MISSGDLAVTLAFSAAALFCFWNGVRGMRGGPLWVDASEDDELRPHAIHGAGARVLGTIYLLTGGGCVFAVLRIYF